MNSSLMSSLITVWRMAPRAAVLGLLSVLAGCAGIVESPYDGQTFPASTSAVRVSGWLQRATDSVYVQAATVAAPDPANPAHWTWAFANPDGSPRAVATSAESRLRVWRAPDGGENLKGYAFAATVVVPARFWFPGNVRGASATLIVRNSTTTAADPQGTTTRLTALGSKLELQPERVDRDVQTVSCETVRGATALTAANDCRSPGSPALRIRTTDYLNVACGSACAPESCPSNPGTWTCSAAGAAACVASIAAETCGNAGHDNDCNGTTDDVPNLGTACMAAPSGCQAGFTAPGTLACAGSTLRCTATAIAARGAPSGSYCRGTSNPTLCGLGVGDPCDLGGACAPGLMCAATPSGAPMRLSCTNTVYAGGVPAGYVCDGLPEPYGGQQACWRPFGTAPVPEPQSCSAICCDAAVSTCILDPYCE